MKIPQYPLNIHLDLLQARINTFNNIREKFRHGFESLLELSKAKTEFIYSVEEYHKTSVELVAIREIITLLDDLQDPFEELKPGITQNDFELIKNYLLLNEMFYNDHKTGLSFYEHIILTKELDIHFDYHKWSEEDLIRYTLAA